MGFGQRPQKLATIDDESGGKRPCCVAENARRRRRTTKSEKTATAPPPATLSTISVVMLIIGTLCPVAFAASPDVDNGVLGSPEVECGRDFVLFSVATKKPFGGRVYVKGEFENPKCVNSVVGEEAGRGGGGGGETDEEKGHGRKKNKGDEEGGRKSGAGRGRNAEEKDEGGGKSRGGDPLDDDGGGRAVPEGTETEEPERQRPAGGQDAGGEEEVDEDTIRQILQELQKRRNNNLNGSQRQIPSHLPGFGSAEQLKRWRSFLKGKPGLDGQGFRRYGSRLSPDANGECPLVCPPCDECDSREKAKKGGQMKRHRRLAGGNSAELRVPLGECNTRRDRMANPPGMQISFTVVVSFHPNFITRVDRAYNIQCAYQEPERLLSTQIDVSPPPIIQISNQMESPQCEYRIHGQGTDQVTNVRVGDMVEHEWACHGNGAGIQKGQEAADEGNNEERERMAELFGLLVHDCFVDDGKSRRAQVVDSRGCSTDPQILPTPEYSPNTLRATILAPVAKFPDGDLVGFQCSITVCVRDMGKCDGVTPPDCSSPVTWGQNGAKQSDNVGQTEAESNWYSSSTDNNRTKRSAIVDDKSSGDTLDWQLNSPLMTVFDLVEGTEEVGRSVDQDSPADLSISARSPSSLRHHDHQPQLCVSLPLFTLLVSVSTFLLTVSAGILIVVLLFFRDYSPQKY